MIIIQNIEVVTDPVHIGIHGIEFAGIRTALTRHHYDWYQKEKGDDDRPRTIKDRFLRGHAPVPPLLHLNHR